MSYPIDFAQVRLDFKGGNSDKFYYLTMLANKDGKAIVIRRFGRNKAGAFGEMKIDTFESQIKAEKEFEKLYDEKTRKGYSVTGSPQNIAAGDQASLRIAVGPAVWSKLPPSAIQHLDLRIPTDGRKELGDTRFDENGKFVGEPKPKTFSAEEIAEARRLEQEEAQREAEKAYAGNSLYGRF
jgi:predicted DNA-binding WGR domain protein